MENNRLEELRGFEFDQLEKLNELYLDHNKIAYVSNQTFKNMHSLEVLSLDENRIVDFIPQWDEVSGARVTLDGNKWSCDCGSLARLEAWVRETGGDPSRLLCAGGGDTVAAVLARCDSNAVATSVVQREVLPGGLGGSYVPLLAATLVAVIVFSLLAAVVFVFRQDVRLWAHSKYGIRLFQDAAAAADNKDERDRLYDCYMVYSHKDEELAARIIAPELEQLGHTLCLHNRDLALHGGASYLADAMVGASDASRRVIFVVSPALICNEWSRPEFRAALQAALRSAHRHKLVCVLSGDPLEPMDPELRALLRACTVTRWGERRFWEKLRYAMPDVDARRRHKNKHQEVRCKARYSAAPDSWYKYSAMPGVHVAALTPTPTQSTYVSGESNRSTEDEAGSSASSQHYGSEQLNHSYVSIDGRPPQYSQYCRQEAPPHHLYSTIPDAQPQSRTYFV